jgi:hypothetical protein
MKAEMRMQYIPIRDYFYPNRNGEKYIAKLVYNIVNNNITSTDCINREDIKIHATQDRYLTELSVLESKP